MTHDVACPGCGFSFKLRPDQLGSKARCAKCSQIFTISIKPDETAKIASVHSTSPTLALLRDAAPVGRSAAVPRDEQNEALPQRISRFEVRRLLGSGAFGKVFRAYDPFLRRDVAVKVPHAAALLSEEAVARALREPQAAAQLQHPHIVPVFEAGVHEGRLYVASSFIEGQTLADAIESRRPDFRQAAEIICKLAEALHYAHHRGIVHRDVKPANVMLDKQGEPHLMDFGLAHWADSSARLTTEGAIMGTPAYMSPEQAGGNSDTVGPAGDQYSLGVMLYQMLCGELPFVGAPMLVLFRIRSDPPPPLRSRNAAVPLELDAICRRAMEKRPEARFADCREFAAALREWLAKPNPAFVAQVVTGNASAPTPAHRQAKPLPAAITAAGSRASSVRKRLAAAGVLTVISVAVAVIVLITTGSREPAAKKSGSTAGNRSSTSDESEPVTLSSTQPEPSGTLSETIAAAPTPTIPASSTGLGVSSPAAAGNSSATTPPTSTVQSIPRHIDDALNSPADFEFLDTPLGDVITFLKLQYKIEIQLDHPALTADGRGEETLVTKVVKGVSLRSALNLTLRDLGLKSAVIDEVVLITTPAGLDAPSPEVQISGHVIPDALAAALATPTSIEYVETPLSDVVTVLKEQHRIEIQFDQVALDDAGFTTDVLINKQIEGVSLRSALNLILRDAELHWLVVDEVVLITTPAGALKLAAP